MGTNGGVWCRSWQRGFFSFVENTKSEYLLYLRNTPAGLALLSCDHGSSARCVEMAVIWLAFSRVEVVVKDFRS